EGTYSVDSAGLLTFSAAGGFLGVSTAQYTMADSFGTVSNTATITVTVVKLLRWFMPRRPALPYQKPPLGALLRRSHPMARDIMHCWLFNEGAGTSVLDLVSGVRGTIDTPSAVKWDVVAPQGRPASLGLTCAATAATTNGVTLNIAPF